MSFLPPEKSQIAATVIVFNRFDKLKDNIDTYISQIDKLYVVDNSDVDLTLGEKYFEEYPTIEYISNLGNPGVANALNTAAKKAFSDGYKFLLTLDDDSKAPSDIIRKMQVFLREHTDNSIGLVSVAHSDHKKGQVFRKVSFTMTSGNLLDLSVYNKVGTFNEDLFIDGVDTEYNLRLSTSGFDVVEISNLFLQHQLGKVESFSVLGKKMFYVSHAPARYYYMVRNTIFLIRKYMKIKPFPVLKLFYILCKEIVKSSFIESEKKIRFSFFLKAINDSLTGNFGKLK